MLRILFFHPKDNRDYSDFLTTMCQEDFHFQKFIRRASMDVQRAFLKLLEMSSPEMTVAWTRRIAIGRELSGQTQVRFRGFPGGSMVKKKKNLPANTRGCRRRGFNPELGRSPGEGNGNLLQLFLPGYSHGQRSLVGYSPWGCKGVTYDLVNKQ